MCTYCNFIYFKAPTAQTTSRVFVKTTQKAVLTKDTREIDNIPDYLDPPDSKLNPGVDLIPDIIQPPRKVETMVQVAGMIASVKSCDNPFLFFLFFSFLLSFFCMMFAYRC